MVGFALLVVAGCRDPRRMPHAAIPVASQPATDEQDPAAVAASFLEACKTMHDLGQRGMRADEDRAAYTNAESRLMGLADREEIEKRWGGAWGQGHSDESRIHRIESIIKNWPSIVAHYVNSVERDATGRIRTASRDSRTGAGKRRFVDVHARADEPEAHEQLEKIRREIEGTKDVREQPLQRGSEEFENHVRRQAVQAGISPLPGADIVLTLRETAAGWRVAGVNLAPLPNAIAAAQAPRARTTSGPTAASMQGGSRQ